MNPRAPYSMVTLAAEVTALDDNAVVEFQNPDGLHIYLELKITSVEHDWMLAALKQVRKFDTRLVEVRDEGDHVVARFSAAGGRWTRDPFQLEAMWNASVPEEKPPVKKTTTKKTTRKKPARKKT